MALNASQQWWIRAGGNVLNGGGFDAAVSGAGTNYADQDSPQLSLTDFATSGAASTTLTSATGGFTSAMVGNVIRIASGTNFQTGYYVVTGYTNANTVTLDRTPTSGGAGSSGVGRLGGAFAHPLSLANGGTATQPTVTSPLAAGHQINLRGAGSDAPSTDDYSQTGYYTFTSGDETSGYVKWVGYNGRPQWSANGLQVFSTDRHSFYNIKSKPTSNSNGGLGIFSGANAFENFVLDQNGQDVLGLSNCLSVVDCCFTNSGSTTAGTNYAIVPGSFGCSIFGNYIENWRGLAIDVKAMAQVIHNLIRNCRASGGAINAGSTTSGYGQTIIGNTIYGNVGDGIRLSHSSAVVNTVIRNNILANNTGYGLNITVNTAAQNARLARVIPDYNCHYGNGNSNVINNGAYGSRDVTLDPQFVNAGSGNFAIGTNLKAIGFPSLLRSSSTTSYVDIGAAQRQESSGGGLLLPRPMNGGYSA